MNTFKTERRFISQKSISVLLVLTTLLTACSFTSPTASPVPPTDTASTQIPESETPTEEMAPTETESMLGTSIVKFPDGSEITLYTDSAIAIITILDLVPAVPAHAISLQKGHIIVNSQLADGIWFTVLNPFNYVAVVTGSSMELAFDPETGLYLMECEEGTCKMGTDNENLYDVLEEQQGCIDETGNFFGPFDDVPFDELDEHCQELIATSTPAPDGQQPDTTPDIRASATAACEEFEGDFPGTPCP